MKFVLFVLLIVIPLRSPATDLPASGSYLPLYQNRAPDVTDLALIYQGGAQRPTWSTNRFAPYVTWQNAETGKEEWLFDGFLFIEFTDGHQHSFEPFPKMEPARKIHWQHLLDRNFAEDGLAALEQTCAAAAHRLGEPVRRRHVVLTLPVPVHGQTNWGQINGQVLDFRKNGDQLAACEWYMDAALAKWRTLAPKELDLAGFYWLQESIPVTNEFFLALSKQVHLRGKQFFWIPYWQPKATNLIANWRACGFDAAWQQPNYFFNPKVPMARLQEACDFAHKNGMGMELEFDGRLLTQPAVYQPRLDAYLAAFTRNGVQAESSMAWYEGGGALYDLAISKDPAMRQQYDRIARFILERQHKADEQSINNQKP